MLIKAVANDIVMADQSIFFSSPIFRGALSTNVLSGMNGGVIRVVNETGKIRIAYKLGFDRSVVLAAFFGMAIFIFSNWRKFFLRPGANIYSNLLDYNWITPAILAILLAVVNYVWSAIYFRFWFGGGLKAQFQSR
jgi:hypothetical protein